MYFRVQPEGSKVLIDFNGTVGEMPWEKALELANALRLTAKAAEEYAKADRIIMDGAIMLRAGVPIGFSNSPLIQAEVRKEAAWNSDLRRYMRGGIKSKEQFGIPAIRQIPPTRKDGDPE